MAGGGARRALRITAKIIGALLLLLILILIGLFLWLRTDSANRLVLNTVTEILAEQGINLSVGELSGPLPQHLHLRDVIVSDAHGELATLAELQLDVRLFSLLGGTLEVTALHVQKPALLRLPEISVQAEAAPPAENAVAASSPLLLPIGLYLEKMTVDNGRLSSAVIFPDFAAMGLPEFFSLNLAADARLQTGVLTGALNAQLLADEEEILSANIEAIQGGVRLFDSEPSFSVPDTLNILIEGSEFANGVISKIAGTPLPAYGIHFSGNGPVSDWTGGLSFSAGVKTPEDPDLLLLGGVFDLKCATGSLWHDLIGRPNWKLRLDANAAPGAKAPEEIRALTEGVLAVKLSADMQRNDLNAALQLDSAAWQIILSDLAFDQHLQGFDAAAHINARINDSAFLERLGLLRLAELPLPLGPMELDTKITAAQRPNELTARSTGTVSAHLDGENVPLNWELHASQSTSLAGQRFKLDLPHFDVLDISAQANAQADMRPAQPGDAPLFGLSGLNAHLELLVPDTASTNNSIRAAWQDVATALAGLEPGALRGSLQLTADAVQAGNTADPAISIALQARNLQLPEGPARALIGNSADLNASASGVLSGAYALHVEELRAAAIQAQGDFAYTAQTIHAEFSAALDDLEALAIEGLSGPLRATISAQGSPAAIDAHIGLTSERLNTPGGVFEAVLAELSGNLDMREGLNGSGALQLHADHTEAGPFDLTAPWTFTQPVALQPADSDMRFKLSDMRALGLGVDMHGSLDGAVPGYAGEPLRLDGTLHAAVDDWSRLTALLQLPVSLGPLVADIALSSNSDTLPAAPLPTGSPLLAESQMHVPPAPSATTPGMPGPGGQSVQAQLSLKRLNMPDSMHIEDIHAQLTARNLFGNPDIDLLATTANGLAGPISWDVGNIAVLGTTGTGDFSVNLSSLAQRAPNPQGTKTDKLALAGSYDLPSSQVNLKTFMLAEPAANAGLRLNAPVSLLYADGLQARDLQLSVLPAGTISADIAITNEESRITAEIKALSLDLLKLLTDAPLPGGDLDASLQYSLAHATPSAILDMQLRILQPADLTSTAEIGIQADIQAVLDNKPTGLAPAPRPPALPGQDAGQARAQAHPASHMPPEKSGSLRGSGTLLVSSHSSGSAIRTDIDEAPTQTLPAGTLDFAIPLHISDQGIPGPDMESPIHAALAWSGQVGSLWQFVPIPGQELSGYSSIKADLDGSLAAPRARGNAYIANGTFEDTLNGILLTALTLEAHATDDGNATLLLSAKDAGDGEISLAADVFNLFESPLLVARGQLRHLQPLQRDDLSITLSGLVSATGPLHAPVIATDILVERGEFELGSASFGGSVRTLEISEADAANDNTNEGNSPTLAVQVEIPRYFFVRGHGLDSEWSGTLHIRGPVSEPQLYGFLRPVRGQFDLLSKAFAFTGGEITFTGGRRINPGINLELTYSGGDITAIAKAGGSLNRPTVTLESRPPLPQDEVLAHVLFGKSMSSLSHFEALQLANGVRELANIGSGGLSPLVSMRKSFGLDVLRIGGTADDGGGRRDSGQSGADDMLGPSSGSSDDDANAPTLEAGKYITDNIYIGVEQGITQDSSAVRIEVELFPRVTLEGRTSTESSRVGIGWKRDY